jgi:uncharacterized membrane protein affecting hemolysin expression
MQTNTRALRKKKNESEEAEKWIENFYSLFNLILIFIILNRKAFLFSKRTKNKNSYFLLLKAAKI